MKKLSLMLILLLTSFCSNAGATYYVKINSNIVTEAKIIGGEENKTPSELPDWLIEEGMDSCDGIRHANFNGNIAFARSNTLVLPESPGTPNAFPEGYRWLSSLEYQKLRDIEAAKAPLPETQETRVFFKQCGNSSYPTLNGESQYVLLFSDTYETGNYIHSGGWEKNIYTDNPEFPDYYQHINFAEQSFAGYVIIKDI